MPYFDKHFTLAEAAGLLPRLREIFGQIGSLIDEARQGQILTLPGPGPLTPGRLNGHASRLQSLSREEITRRINDLITEITDQGIVIQDIDRGLIDFPAFIHGEEVFLCYELSDGDRIQYYHGLNAGYAGRQKLPEGLE